MSVQITILGLDRVGASLGLALASAKNQVTRVGSDARIDISRLAVKQGVVDRATFNLPEAVSKADAVVLALPVEDMRLNMEAIAADLKPGVVILDMSMVPSQFLAWAKELFPQEDRYPLTFTPALNPAYFNDMEYGLVGAHADLFQNSSIFIANPLGVDESAIQFAENLARLVGASPVFADAQEMDGLISSTRLLPELLSAAFVGATIGKPGWQEARRLAGGPYAQVSQALQGIEGEKSPGQAALVNRAGALNGIDVLVDELLTLRSLIEAGEGEKLDERLNRARERRADWLRQRSTARYEDGVDRGAPLPTIGDTLGRLIGLKPKSLRDQNEKRR